MNIVLAVYTEAVRINGFAECCYADAYPFAATTFSQTEESYRCEQRNTECAAMVESLLLYDQRLFLLLNGLHAPFLDHLFWCITQLGNGWILGPLLIGIVIVAVPRRSVVRVLLWGIVAISVSGMINARIKYEVHRARPVAFFAQHNQGTTILAQTALVGEKKPVVHVVGKALRSRSFPSGHANAVFAAATFLALLFGGSFWWSYVVAALVGYSRIYVGAHFPLDVATGALLAVVVVTSFMHFSGLAVVRVTGEKHD